MLGIVGVKSNLARLAADWQAARGRGGGLSLAATIIKPDANLSKDKSSLYFSLPRLLSSPGTPVRGGDWSQARPCHQRQLQDICSFLEQFLPRPRPPGSWWLPTQLKAVTDNNNNKHGATHQPSHVSLVTNKKTAAQLHLQYPVLLHHWELHYDGRKGRVGHQIFTSGGSLMPDFVPCDLTEWRRGIVWWKS